MCVVVIHNYNLCKLWGFCSCVAEHSILGFVTSSSVISQKKGIHDYNLVYWEKGNLSELDINVLHCLCVLSLFIKIQLHTLKLYTLCYCILQYFWHVLAHIKPSKGRQIQRNMYKFASSMIHVLYTWCSSIRCSLCLKFFGPSLLVSICKR